MRPIIIKRARKYERDNAVSDLLKRDFELVNIGEFDQNDRDGIKQYTTYWAKLVKVK